MHRLSLRQVTLSFTTGTCNLEPRNSECSSLKTSFLYAQVKFKTGFLYAQVKFKTGFLYAQVKFKTDFLYAQVKFKTGFLYAQVKFKTGFTVLMTTVENVEVMSEE